MSHNKRGAALALAVVIALFAAACSSDSKTTSAGSASASGGQQTCQGTTGSVAFGHIYSTSPSFPAATQFQQGMDIFFKALNDKGGVNCKSVTMTSIDDQATAQGTLTAYQTLSADSSNLFITGLDSSANAAAVVDQAARDKIPLILGVTTLRAATQPTQPYIFALAEVARDSYTSMALFAQKKGLNKVAMLFTDTPEAHDAATFVEGFLSKNGMEAVDTQFLPQTGTLDYTAPIAEVKSKGANVILSVFGPQGYLTMKKAMDAQQFDVPLLAHNSGLQRATLESFPPGAFIPETLWSVDPTAPGYAEMAAAAKKYGNVDEVSAPNVGGWIAGELFAEALKQCGTSCTRDTFRSTLESIKNFDTKGLSLPITFGPDDHYAPEGTQFFALTADKKIEKQTDFLQYPPR